MAREVRSFEVLVPAGTPKSAPLVVPLAMPPRVVRRVRVRIPPGPGGTVGWALGAAGERVIPWGPGEWIVGDDEVLDWELAGQIDSGAWQLQAYNVGVFDHSLYMTFELDPVASPTVPLGRPLTLEVA